VHLNIVEVRKPEIDATLVAQSIAQQLERRVAFRRAMKRAVQSAMRSAPKASGSTAPAVLAARKSRATEWYREGRVPLHTLRADVDYGTAEAKPPTASSASRSGSSKARSWSTIRWPPNAGALEAADRRTVVAAAAKTRRAEARIWGLGLKNDAATETDKVPQASSRADQGRGQGRHRR
jgi:hypothetical protein